MVAETSSMPAGPWRMTRAPRSNSISASPCSRRRTLPDRMSRPGFWSLPVQRQSWALTNQAMLAGSDSGGAIPSGADGPIRPLSRKPAKVTEARAMPTATPVSQRALAPECQR